MPWRDDEPAFGGAAEVRRLATRALRRPLVTLALALGAAAVAVGLDARARPAESTVLLRVTEGSLVAGAGSSGAPLQSRALRAHVAEELLTNARLEALMRREGLYPLERARGNDRALESFRRDLDVEVWHNDLAVERDTGDPPRSARVAIHYRALAPEVAWRVARALARTVVAAEQEERDRTARVAIESLRSAAEVGRARLWLRRADGPGARREELGALVDRLASLEQRLLAEELRARSQRRGLGLGFTIVDEGRVAEPLLSPRVERTLVGTVGGVLSLPVVAVLVAAFDRRVHLPADVTRLGLRALGRVPRARRGG